MVPPGGASPLLLNDNFRHLTPYHHHTMPHQGQRALWGDGYGNVSSVQVHPIELNRVRRVCRVRKVRRVSTISAAKDAGSAGSGAVVVSGEGSSGGEVFGDVDQFGVGVRADLGEQDEGVLSGDGVPHPSGCPWPVR